MKRLIISWIAMYVVALIGVYFSNTTQFWMDLLYSWSGINLIMSMLFTQYYNRK